MVWLFIFLYRLLEPCICKLSELLHTWNPRSSSAFFLNFFFNWLTKFYLKPCHTNVPVQVTEGTWEIDSIGMFIFSALLIFEINSTVSQSALVLITFTIFNHWRWMIKVFIIPRVTPPFNEEENTALVFVFFLSFFLLFF